MHEWLVMAGHLAENGNESGGEGCSRVGPLYILVNTDWGALQERERGSGVGVRIGEGEGWG